MIRLFLRSDKFGPRIESSNYLLFNLLCTILKLNDPTLTCPERGKPSSSSPRRLLMMSVTVELAPSSISICTAVDDIRYTQTSSSEWIFMLMTSFLIQQQNVHTRQNKLLCRGATNRLYSRFHNIKNNLESYFSFQKDYERKIFRIIDFDWFTHSSVGWSDSWCAPGPVSPWRGCARSLRRPGCWTGRTPGCCCCRSTCCRSSARTWRPRASRTRLSVGHGNIPWRR